ncbi:hypothetical protein RB195_002475 [Necator americanus]|uniref:Uncharacterized protein n=1 Tax=Necator americanus TaxID=51031 RepID=A0ABR1DJ91_NECAM
MSSRFFHENYAVSMTMHDVLPSVQECDSVRGWYGRSHWIAHFSFAPQLHGLHTYILSTYVPVAGCTFMAI